MTRLCRLEYIKIPADVEATFAESSSDYPSIQSKVYFEKSVINCMVKQATRTTTQKEVLLTSKALKSENKKFINKNVVKWMFSHWPCYRPLVSRIGLWMAVLARGCANTAIGGPSGHFKCPQTCNRQYENIHLIIL